MEEVHDLTAEPRLILVAEDNRFDQLILKRVFKAAGLPCVVQFVEDGAELLSFLRREGKFAGMDGPEPTLVLLDLVMPNVDGWQALATIRQDQALKRVPVVAMSTLSSPEDVADLLKRGANGYFTKPIDFHDFVAEVRGQAGRWLAPRPATVH